MRAVLIENLSVSIDDDFLLDHKESVHHLLNVLRVRLDDEVLLLNGEGLNAFGVISNISKKSINFRIKKCEEIQKTRSIDLYLCIPKREALDLSLKQAVELGIQKIVLIESTYSQRIKLNPQRIKKVLISALEQSNNPFMPEVVGPIKFEKFLKEASNVVCFTSNKSASSAGNLNNPSGFLIGPEGGFSSEEEDQLKGPKIYLDVPIMRTPTALSCAFGYLSALQRV